MAFSEHFEHSLSEPQIYRRWEDSKAFVADVNSSRPQFTISMPPPNATGTLHLGHAIMLAIEDLLIRWKRMAGYEVLWVPGTDHAAIATESVVIKNLQREGIADPRAHFGRDELLRQIADYVEKSRSTIRSQIRAMGASCDWSRERYTMDPQLSRCVSSVFSKMFRDGLIYRGKRVVNWDPSLRTTVSDDEIEHAERQAEFYTIRYGPFLVGTSRPETKLGDTAVAVHPDDPRWKQFIGKTMDVAWPAGPTITVKVVAESENVDPETGTGVVGVTPAHSQIDAEIGQRHNLPVIQVIGEDGRMTEAAGPYAGMTVLECRKQFVHDLKEAGLLAKEEAYQQKVSICYRSKQPIEPLLKDQWFIDVNKPVLRWKNKLLSIKQVLRSVVQSGEIRIVPDHERRKYFEWIDKLRDWCISRQIWWGHRVPVWYRGEEDLFVGAKPPDGDGWTQDPDTLDTWFSSALWTWSTLIDPRVARDTSLSLMQVLDQSPDFKRFHPTSVMETGYDILFFWVARMILMTTYAVGAIPFEVVYLHGLILDKDGEKMTKSKPETCIDPLDVISNEGADTLRLSLLLGSTAGRDTRLGKDQLVACSRFINKMWNAAKLIQRSTPGKTPLAQPPREARYPVNRWMVTRMNELIQTVTARLEGYSFSDAGERIRESFWNHFCDFYLEAIKLKEVAAMEETTQVLLQTFGHYLRLCHPFIPFVTEEIWSQLGYPGLLLTSEWPKADRKQSWPIETAGVDAVMRIISAIRSVRLDRQVDPKATVDVAVQPKDYGETISACREIICRLARVREITIDNAATTRPDTSVVIDHDFSLAVSLEEADFASERARLAKQLELEERRLEKLEKLLADGGFLNHAKKEAIDSATVEAANTRGAITAIHDRLRSIT